MYHPIYNACLRSDRYAIKWIVEDYYDKLYRDLPVIDHETFLWHAFDGAFKSNNEQIVQYIKFHSHRAPIGLIMDTIIKSNIHTEAMRTYSMKFARNRLREEPENIQIYNFIDTLLERFEYTPNEVFGNFFPANTMIDYDMIGKIWNFLDLHNFKRIKILLRVVFNEHEHKGDKSNLLNNESNLFRWFDYNSVNDIVEYLLEHKNSILPYLQIALSNISECDKTISYYKHRRNLIKELVKLLQRMPKYIEAHLIGMNTSTYYIIVYHACQLGFLDIVQLININRIAAYDHNIVDCLTEAILNGRADIALYIITNAQNMNTNIIQTTFENVRNKKHMEGVMFLYLLFPHDVSVNFTETIHLLNNEIDVVELSNDSQRIRYFRDRLILYKELISSVIIPIVNTLLYESCPLYDEHLSGIINAYIPYVDITEDVFKPALDYAFNGCIGYDKFLRRVILDYLNDLLILPY